MLNVWRHPRNWKPSGAGTTTLNCVAPFPTVKKLVETQSPVSTMVDLSLECN
jgi:hypothetical protein